MTGASAGIGEAFARALAARGHDLILVARRKQRLEELSAQLKSEHGAESHVIASDLGKAEAPRQVFDAVEKLGLQLDLLVNNAGYGSSGPFHTQEHEWEMGQIDLNVRALAALAHLFSPGMVQRGKGRIINLGSVGSFMSCPYMATYAATKAFILSFSEAISAELAPHGVQVTCVCPGGTSTEFQQIAKVEVEDVKGTFMSAESVVEIALRDLEARRPISISGWMNRLAVRLAWLTPRGLLTMALKKGLEGRFEKK